MQVVIRPAGDLPADALEQMVAESEQDGWRFVRRLVDDLHSGANRFDREGECLFVAVSDGAVVGVCGLNIDPFVDDPPVGRVRRLYVLAAYRGSGVGQRLVQTIVSSAIGKFRCLRVRTSNPQAGRLYERLGFAPVADAPDCTHILRLTEDEP